MKSNIKYARRSRKMSGNFQYSPYKSLGKSSDSDVPSTVSSRSEETGLRLTDMAWCAGIIDGEGCFSLEPSSARISVESTSRITIESLFRILGGKASVIKRKTQAGKTVFRWYTHKNMAYETCEKLIEHLVEKKAQAELLMIYLKYPFKSAMRESIRSRMRQHKDIGNV